MPSCDEVTVATGAITDGLSYDADLSASQTADEAYPQRVCVYTVDDATQVGVTIAEIPFQQTELDQYATLPGAIADERLDEHSGVLQTFVAGDGDDGHLDSPLYLFDTRYSITIQGVSSEGSTVESLPALTVVAAADAAFAVRELLG